MGTPLAVSAAVIYMAKLEDPLLTTGGLLFYRTFFFHLDWESAWTSVLSESTKQLSTDYQAYLEVFSGRGHFSGHGPGPWKSN